MKLKIALSLIFLACLSGLVWAEPLAPSSSFHWKYFNLIGLSLPAVYLALRKRSSPAPEYTLLEELGRGATAVVYNARHNATRQHYALKLLKNEPGQDQDATARMRREIKLMRELQHPGIVSLCDCGEYQGQSYLVMEKIVGETLRDHLNRQRFSQRQAESHLDSLLDALSYAHSRNVIHRDLKPENLMLGADGRIRLLDFGFSRSAQRNTFETMDNSVAGTPAYMAPERLMCQNLAASDQYSLGLIAYEMLTGQPAIARGLDVAAVITKQLQEVPPSPRSLDASISEETDRLVMKLIAKKPEDRFESMQAALEAFRATARP